MLTLASIFTDIPEAIVVFFHDTVGLSWGAAIIALTFTVRLAIVPLSLRQIRSMRALQELQPQLKAIQEKYKDDRQRQQQEMMKFYQENEINPLASCVPLLLQLPVFIALFYMLRGESFRCDVRSAQEPPCDIPGPNEGFLFIESILEKPLGSELVILIVPSAARGSRGHRSSSSSACRWSSPRSSAHSSPAFPSTGSRPTSGRSGSNRW
jgi:YidC/Oxa1 family membrane protein insertase